MPADDKKSQEAQSKVREVPEELQDSMTQGDVLLIIGTGVSLASTRASCASWSGLLTHGLNWCKDHRLFEQIAKEARQPLEDYIRALATSSSSQGLIRAASEIERLLGGPEGGEFGIWLADSIGRVKADEHEVLNAIRDLERLGVRLATTNYDALLEDATGLHPVTWQNQHQATVQKIVRGKSRGVLHIHGFWNEPESVVFSAESYERLKKDLHTKAIIEAVQTLRTVIFVGCGSGGISDPHFSRLLDFSREVLKRSPYRRFLLCRDCECTKLWEELRDTGIKPVAYGPDYGDLEGFLKHLHPGQQVAALWRSFSPDNKNVTIVPSQLETPLAKHEDMFDYTNSTAEMDLVKQLEDEPLKWFGFDTKQHLGAHLPQRWFGNPKDRDPADPAEIEREKKLYYATDEIRMRGRSLIVLGSPACNRVSQSIVKEVYKGLGGRPKRRWKHERSPEALRLVGERFLAKFKSLFGGKSSELPQELLVIDNAFFTWAVVIRTVASICDDKETSSRHEIILGGGENAEGTYASLCKEAQQILSDVIEKEGSPGDFAAVFEVKLGIDPRTRDKEEKKPHGVRAIKLVSFCYPRLGGDKAADCSKQELTYLRQNSWKILVLDLCSTAETASLKRPDQLLEKENHEVRTCRDADELAQCSNSDRLDLILLWAASVSAIRDVWFNEDTARLLTSLVGPRGNIPIVVVAGQQEQAEAHRILSEKFKHLRISWTRALTEQEVADAVQFVGAPSGDEQFRKVLDYLFPDQT